MIYKFQTKPFQTIFEYLNPSENKFYGLEQSCHGHAYRYIMSEAALQQANPYCADAILQNRLDKACVDIYFPIDGSNSSATYFVRLHTEDEIKAFLTGDYCTDYDDPELVDIAEGLCTIETSPEYGNMAGLFVLKFGIPEEKLTVENALLQRAEDLIAALPEDADFDFNDPFYGRDKNMCLSELEDLVKSYQQRNRGQER